jgi:hypothetical protein
LTARNGKVLPLVLLLRSETRLPVSRRDARSSRKQELIIELPAVLDLSLYHARHFRKAHGP